MTKARSIANVIRRVFLERARRYEGQDIAISLSGGVDSCAVLAAFMEVGIEPLCLSYTPSTHESTDFVMAQQTAENLGLKFEPVVVDMGADNLEALAREVIGHGWPV